MQPSLQGVAVALVGGDAREKILAARLAALGAAVRAVGLPVEGEGIETFADIAPAVAGARALILPVRGIDEEGRIYGDFMEQPQVLLPDHLCLLPPGSPVLVGVARPSLREMAERAGVRLVELMEMDEVAILNSIPSAEGAIQAAMESLPITIHGSRCAVLGFGRTGMTLARMLHALGARTLVVARNPAQLARAFEMGLDTASFAELPGVVAQADVIFNTVPALVLDEQVLRHARPDTLILDLASSPGGTDFEAARRLGLKARLLPGLPGKVAPRTAGEILARVVPRLLADLLAL